MRSLVQPRFLIGKAQVLGVFVFPVRMSATIFSRDLEFPVQGGSSVQGDSSSALQIIWSAAARSGLSA